MKRKYLAIAACLLPLLATAVVAEEKGPARQRIRPDGVDGWLLLTGHTFPQEAPERFLDLAGKDKANIIIVASKDKPDVFDTEILKATWKGTKATIVVVPSGDEAALLDALPKSTGVWLLSAPPRGSKAEQEVNAVLKRGGIVAATDKAATHQLAGSIVSAVFIVDKPVFKGFSETPHFFGVVIEAGGAVFVHGREMSRLGYGKVTIFLAKTSTAPERTIELTAKSPLDLTMLRRAAQARADGNFPPKSAPLPEVPKGSLVIVGGGGMPADVTKKFIELAGGPDARIVVLPTAQPEPLPLGGANEGAFLKRAGAKNVIVLNIRKLEDVEDPKTLEFVKKAGGIWFGGGRQWRFVDAYENTKMHEAFREVLKNGGVIGGSSAGATIQGDYLCRGSPLNNTDMMCEGYERGLGFLPGVAIDQHFAQRKRFADMTELMKSYPQFLGIGLDEATAIVVRGHVADVMGNGEVHFYDRKKPLEKDKPDHESIKAGGRYNLEERKPLPADGK